jgi:ribosome biogenesis protein
MPPQKISDFPHEDWVSSVSCQLKGYVSFCFFNHTKKATETLYCSYFLTASYDGQIRAFDYSKTLVSNSLIHPAPITSLCVVSSNDDEGSYTIATSSHDLSAQISQFTIHPIGMDIDTLSTSTSKPLASLQLHTGPVSSVTSDSGGTHLLTSSWDGLIGLWDTSIPSSDEVPEPALNERDWKKRRKVDDSDKPSSESSSVGVEIAYCESLESVVCSDWREWREESL